MRRAVSGLWRWRTSPLFRVTDRREAWLTLWSAVLIVAGAPLAGWLAGSQAHEVLSATAHRQHVARHQVWATVEGFVHRPAEGGADEDDSGLEEGRGARVYWVGPDGVTRSDVTTVGRGLHPGDRVRLWAGARGRITTAPMSEATASFHAVLTGLVGGAAAGGAVEGGRRLVLSGMRRARYARWEEEWARSGPDWGRTGTGN
jgi:hypothetical protein